MVRRESTVRVRKRGSRSRCKYAGFSALRVVRADDLRSHARLTGAMETLREETGHAPLPDQQRLSEQTSSALVSELGEERLAVALAVGREMTFEQAVAYALQP